MWGSGAGETGLRLGSARVAPVLFDVGAESPCPASCFFLCSTPAPVHAGSMQVYPAALLPTRPPLVLGPSPPSLLKEQIHTPTNPDLQALALLAALAAAAVAQQQAGSSREHHPEGGWAAKGGWLPLRGAAADT